MEAAVWALVAINGEASTRTHGEGVLGLLIMLMGIIVMAFLIGDLSNIMSNLDPVANEFKQTLDNLNEIRFSIEPSSILLEEWFIKRVLLNKCLTQALRSLLGKNVGLPVIVSNHRIKGKNKEQGWHHDADCIYSPEINYLEVFYYPQDTTKEMGPTEKDVALSLCNTIPVDGVLITGEDQKTDLMRNIAGKNESRFIHSNESTITKEELEKFTYMEHPSNVAVALDACKEAGVERKTALAGMHKVKPDLGALIAWNLDLNGKNIQFINGMAANDPVSTLQIWKFIMDRYPAEGGTCVFFNSREDRPSRTRQMIELTFLEIKPDYFMVRGDKVLTSIERQKHHSENTRVNVIGLDDPIEKIIEKMAEIPNHTLVYAIGNQVGVGQDILELVSTFRNHG